MNIKINKLCRDIAAASLVVAALAGCKDNSQAANNTLNVAFFADNTQFVSLDPFQLYWIENRAIIRNVVDSLTDQDPKTGDVVPWLADDWAISEDGLTYTFHLKKGVTFSNGEKFNADAVKLAFDSNKSTAAQLPSTFGSTYLSGYDRSEVVDEYTVKLILSKPNAGFLQATSTTTLGILAPEAYRHSEKDRAVKYIIGSGPFVVDSYAPGEKLRLVKRTGYAWASTNARNKSDAYLDAVEVSYIPEEMVRNGLFLQGKVDILWPRDPFSSATQSTFEDKGASIVGNALPGTAWSLYANIQEGHVLSDPKVRSAVQVAIDRTSYAQTVFNDHYPVVKGVYDTTTPYFSNQEAKLKFNGQSSMTLLNDAGWTVAEDGYRYKNGAKLTLNYNVPGKESSGDILLQDQLKKSGIDLKINVKPLAEWVTSNSAGHYDLAYSSMTRADPIIIQTILDARSAATVAIANNAFTPTLRSEAEKLFDAGVNTSNKKQRAEAYANLQSFLIDNNIAFPIYERYWQAAVAPRVQNISWTADGLIYLADITLKK